MFVIITLWGWREAHINHWLQEDGGLTVRILQIHLFATLLSKLTAVIFKNGCM